ncbi:MAG: hypothetical protein ACK4V2_04045 [Pseudomonadota bacterium]|jgi:hypothetical protein|nr:hypothetical protein [Alphaproteobacteria bacterium]
MTRFFILLTFLFLIVSACFCPPAPGTLQVAPTPPSGLTIAVGYYAVGITEEENVRRATRVAEIQALYPGSDCDPIYFYNNQDKEQTLILISNLLDEAEIEKIMLFTRYIDGIREQTELVRARVNSTQRYFNVEHPNALLAYQGTDDCFYAAEILVNNGISLISTLLNFGYINSKMGG